MSKQSDDFRTTPAAGDRPALEEAPTVLTRNPFHLDEKLMAPEDDESASLRPRATGRVLHSDDQTHVSSRSPESSGSSITHASPLKLGQLLEGEMLGHFHLEKCVGGGGMGSVFRALDTMLGRIVAVKVLSRERTDADTLRRFKNEAQSAARLDHKNIARVHYVGEDEGWNYIVFEFIDGVNIRDMVEKQGPLDVDDALHFTMQVAEVLDHAAQREVVHRDIKPSNIIITSGSRAKLVDMGLARLHQVESSNDDITASGVTLGTFDYISPEQARDPRAADVRSDIYSLGCTLYYMLCGRPPFPEGTVLQKLLSHNSDRPPDLQIFRPEVPDDIVDVVNRMLAKQPSQRYQTPAELMSELLLLAQKYQLTKITAPTELWTETKPLEPSAWERHLPWMAPLAILLLSVLAMDFVFPASQPMLSDLAPAAAAAPRAPNAPTVQPEDPPAAPSVTPTEISPPPAAEPPGAAPVRAPAESEQPAAAESIGSTLPSVGPPASAANADSIGPAATGNQRPTTPATPLPAPATPAAGEAAGSSQPPMETLPLEPAPVAPTPAARPGVITISRTGETEEKIVERLQDALRQVAASDQFHEVQLDFDGPLNVAATLHLDAIAARLSNAPGRTPELRFSPLEGKPARTAMLAFRGKSLVIAGVRLTMTAPSDPIAPDGWAMIHLGAAAERVDLRDTVLTLANPQAAELQEHGTAFIRLEPLPFSRMGSSDPQPLAASSSADIMLERCIVRGEATFLRVQPGKAVAVTWNQGLLAISERMLDLENVVGTTSPFNAVRLSLSHVTAVAEKGLCRLGAHSEPVTQPLPLHVELNGCIVRTSPTMPLVEQLGVDARLHDPDMMFALEQSGTRFSRTLIRQKFNGLDREDKLKADSITWKNLPPAAKPWHESTSDDYEAVAAPADPAGSPATPAGFDSTLLPRIAPPTAAQPTPVATRSDAS